MIEHEFHPEEKPTKIFTVLPELTEGYLTLSNGEKLLKAFEIPAKGEAFHLSRVGMRFHYNDIPRPHPNWKLVQRLLNQADLKLELKYELLCLYADDSRETPLTPERIDTLDKLASVLLYNRFHPAALPSFELHEPMLNRIAPPFLKPRDWEDGLDVSLKLFAKALYGESFCRQSSNHVILRLPTRISADEQDPRGKWLLKLAREHEVELKLEEDIRIDGRSALPKAHWLGSKLTITAHFDEATRDKRILDLVSFANRLGSIIFKPDTVWEEQAESIRVGTTPVVDFFPPFPLWCSYCPGEIFAYLPLSSKLSITMFDEFADRAEVKVPNSFPRATHVDAARFIHSKRYQIDYYTRVVDNVLVECFSANFEDRGRSKALLALFNCLKACFIPRGDDNFRGKDDGPEFSNR